MLFLLQKIYSKGEALIVPKPLVCGSNRTAIMPLPCAQERVAHVIDRGCEGVSGREKTDGRNGGLVKPFSSSWNPREPAANYFVF